MRKVTYFLSFLMLLIFFSGSFLQTEELKPSEIIKNASSSVVKIVLYDKTGEISSWGSGFFIAPQLILTCAHVMEDAFSADIVSEKGHYRKVKILRINKTKDLALLMVDSTNERPLQFELKKQIVKDQHVISLGYYRLDLASDNIALAEVERYGQHLIVSHAKATDGWSGGPLLNKDGNVVGVMTSSLGTEPEISLAIGLETVQDFLKEPNNIKLLPEAGSGILWRVILKKFVGFWVDVFEWISNSVIVLFIKELIFNGGWIRFVCIMALGIILIGLILKELLRSKRDREMRKYKKIYMEFIEV
jgi:hypothetical protein